MPEISANAVAHRLLAPRVVYLLGTRDQQGESNLIPVSNVTSVSTQPQHIAVAVFKEWHSHQALLRREGFTLSIPELGQLAGVWKLGAKYSKFPAASVADKIASSEIVIDESLSEFGPVVPSGIGWLICQIIARLDLGGNHTTFIGEVRDVWFNPEFLHTDGTPVVAIKPIMQQTGNFFTTAISEQMVLPYF